MGRETNVYESNPYRPFPARKKDGWMDDRRRVGGRDGIYVKLLNGFDSRYFRKRARKAVTTCAEAHADLGLLYSNIRQASV